MRKVEDRVFANRKTITCYQKDLLWHIYSVLQREGYSRDCVVMRLLEKFVCSIKPEDDHRVEIEESVTFTEFDKVTSKREASKVE